MTLFLASVRDAAEAETALAAGADIIDLKEPDGGTLGRVGRGVSGAILSAVGSRVETSATIGDLPMQPAAIEAAVRERASLGVNYVKLGLFPDGDSQGSLAALRPLATRIRLILVVFADMPPGFDAVAAANAIGAAGIMLDTARKNGGSLLDHLALSDVAGFVTRGRAHGLKVGLAGSLACRHVSPLLGVKPDILGFRGALCSGSRNGTLDLSSCLAIRALVPRGGPAGAGVRAEALNLSGEEALC